MGTPQRGADAASWANFVARAVKALQTGTSNTSLLSDLRKNSGTLRQISQQFVEHGSTIKMKAFYETKKLDYMNSLVYFLWTKRLLEQGLIWCDLGRRKGCSYTESTQ